MMLVSLQKLLKIANPLNFPPWREIKGPILDNEILNCQEIKYEKEYDSLQPQTRDEHIRKIAFFVKNGWQDDPITIILNKNIYPIYDGNHRVCAAIIRNDEYIIANVEGPSSKIKDLSF